MAERIELTESDLIEAILAAQAVQEGPAGALTTQQLCADTGLSDGAVRRKLWSLQLAGRLEVCQVAKRTLSGRVQPVPAYRLRGGSNGSAG